MQIHKLKIKTFSTLIKAEKVARSQGRGRKSNEKEEKRIGKEGRKS